MAIPGHPWEDQANPQGYPMEERALEPPAQDNLGPLGESSPPARFRVPMPLSWPRPLRVPVVAVLCLLVFMVYGLGPAPALTVTCTAPGRQAETQAHCQVRQPRRFVGLPAIQRDFNLVDVAITSQLCDNTPRGGVRFCHRLTLLGDQGQVTLPEIRTPLSADTFTDRLRSFAVGQGGDRLSWTIPARGVSLLRTLGIGLLLALTAWGFWSVQWPPLQPSPLALDGAEDGPNSKKG